LRYFITDTDGHIRKDGRWADPLGAFDINLRDCNIAILSADRRYQQNMSQKNNGDASDQGGHLKPHQSFLFIISQLACQSKNLEFSI
jgi:hypothetical protein